MKKTSKAERVAEAIMRATKMLNKWMKEQGEVIDGKTVDVWLSNDPKGKTCGAYDICHTLYWKKETQLKPVFGKSTSSRVRG